MTVHTDIPELEQMRNYSEENRPDWSIVCQLTPDVGKSQNSVGQYVEHLVTKLDPDMIARVRNHGFPYKSLSTSGVPVNRKPRVYKPKQLFPSKGLKKSQNLIDWDEYMTTGTSSLQQPNYDGESKSIMVSDSSNDPQEDDPSQTKTLFQHGVMSSVFLIFSFPSLIGLYIRCCPPFSLSF